MMLNCITAAAQQLAFTSRTYVQSPVIIQSVESTKDYGFEAVTLRNDGHDSIRAVHFLVMLRCASGDEVMEQRRVAADVGARESKKVVVGMGQVKGLRDHVRSRNQESGLAIITVEAIEYRDGSEWKRPDSFSIDVPVEPADIPRRK